MVEHVVGEGSGADDPDDGEDQAEEVTRTGGQPIAKEEREPGAQHSAGGGDPEQFWEWELNGFHKNGCTDAHRTNAEQFGAHPAKKDSLGGAVADGAVGRWKDY
jgi:hypothetical protein